MSSLTPLPFEAFGNVSWYFPFDGMEIGNSFFIPCVRPAACIYILENYAKEFSIRVKPFVVTEDGYLGVRVWRVS